MDFSDPKRNSRYLSKIIMVALLTAMCVVMLTQPPCHRKAPSVVSGNPSANPSPQPCIYIWRDIRLHVMGLQWQMLHCLVNYHSCKSYTTKQCSRNGTLKHTLLYCILVLLVTIFDFIRVWLVFKSSHIYVMCPVLHPWTRSNTCVGDGWRRLHRIACSSSTAQGLLQSHHCGWYLTQSCALLFLAEIQHHHNADIFFPLVFRIIYQEEILGQSRFFRTCFLILGDCNSYMLI